MGESGIPVDIYTREHDGIAGVELIAPNVRVIHLPGGPHEAGIGELYAHLPDFLDEMRAFRERDGTEYEVAHSHYWLSAWIGQRFSRELGIPHVVTFHTLALIKMQSRAGETEPEERAEVERDAMLTAGPHRRLQRPRARRHGPALRGRPIAGDAGPLRR